MVVVRQKLCLSFVELEALVHEETKDMWDKMSKLSDGSFRHFTRNIRSCSSYQYMRGRRLREISQDL